jgi:hypothetical protein
MCCFYMPAQWRMACLHWAAGEKLYVPPSPPRSPPTISPAGSLDPSELRRAVRMALRLGPVAAPDELVEAS